MIEGKVDSANREVALSICGSINDMIADYTILTRKLIAAIVEIVPLPDKAQRKDMATDVLRGAFEFATMIECEKNG